MKSLDLNIDNQTLVEECRSGDRDALSILYTRFAPRMLHVITRYVSDRDCANEILHDGFIAAFTRLDTLHNPDRIDFWLASIMKNLSLKYLQAQNITSILEEIPETADEPEINNIIDFDTLESLIRKLPEGYQKVFRLAVLEGKSHKEISKILGIAPNSSSSQLFHAKLRLRELIKDYQVRAGLISLLLLLVSAGILFLTRHDDMLLISDYLSDYSMQRKETPTTDNQLMPACDNASQESTSPVNAKSAYSSISSTQTKIAMEKASDDSVSDDSLQPESAIQSVVESDSIKVSTPTSKQENQLQNPIFEDNYYATDQLFAKLPHKTNTDKGWSAGISVDPGMLSFNGMIGEDSDNNYGDVGTWSPPEADNDSNDSSTPSKMPRSTQGIESYLESASRRHHLPLSFAITAEKRISSWLGLESGIGYSYLHTDFERPTLTGSNISTCHWHYLEIPLKMNLYAYTSPRLKLYFGFGGRVAMPIYSYADIAHNYYCQSGPFDSKAVWSVGGNVGAAFRLSKRVDLFIEPSIQYHFPQDCKIPNIWTDDEPWSISIPIGFRFSW